MKLNHINLTVTDVAAAAHFLETYFGLRRQGGNNGMAVLLEGMRISVPSGFGYAPSTPQSHARLQPNSRG